MILKCCLGMNDDAVQAGVLKEFFEFLKAQGTKVNITPIEASKIIDEVPRWIRTALNFSKMIVPQMSFPLQAQFVHWKNAKK